MNKIAELEKRLVKRLGKYSIKRNELLSKYTTFKIGGPAKSFVTVTNSDDLANIIIEAKQLEIPYFLLGGGSNILVSDSGFNGLVIKNGANKIRIKSFGGIYNKKTTKKEVFIEVDSGVALNRLVRFTLDENLSGLEAFLGQPGSVGGSVVMNSHNMRMNDYFGDHIISAKIINNKGQIIEVKKNYFKFDYDRSSIQRTKETILSVTLRLSVSEKTVIWKKAEEATSHRKNSQPVGSGSAGCIFRNISKAESLRIGTPNGTTSAGYLIEAVGLKGYTVGQARVSEKHANFIINLGNARASDIVKLIELIKEKVLKRFKIDLKEEIIIIGG